VLAVVLFAGTAAGQDLLREVMARADRDLQDGRIAEAVAGFDAIIAREPQAAPHLWQRGIALFYAARYDDCRRQFESHRTVNPDDVENAAWHFLCVARQATPERARAALLPVGPDGRRPMREVYELFRGKLTPADVMRAAGSDAEGLFYGNLYVGLYFDVTGDAAAARRHLTAAADERFAAVGGYMHRIARLHVTMSRDRR
jgi:lipoprotein NlpI